MFVLFPLTGAAQTRIEVYFDASQKTIKEIYFVEDTISMQLEGPYQSFYVSGQLKEKGSYQENRATGYWEYFYESGNPKMRGELREGSNFGHWQYFYENGNLSMEGPIFEGQRQDEWVHYYENGSIKRRGKYLNNKMVGTWNYFYESQQGGYGPMKAQAFYQDGMGTYKEFYPNGRLKAEGLYVDGRSEGLWTFYLPEGGLEAKGNYENGLKSGEWEYFHPEGTKAAVGNYTSGLREGDWTFFYENGIISSEGEMENGKKDGYWRLFNSWGDFTGEGVFVKGEGEFKEFYESGKIKTEGFIKDDQNQGEWKYYYEDGRLEGKANFKNGRGYYTGYYPDGTINMEGEIENGQRTGIWKMYKESGELSGFYQVFYEDNQAVYKIIDKEKKEDRSGTDKPEFRFKVRKFRNFTPQVNEFKALIVATNPFASLHGSLPVSLEYYIQERLGYDLQLSYLRDPFFVAHKNLGLNRTYFQGFSFALKQKFYQPEDKLGMFYYGHEFRVSPLKHYYHTGHSLAGETERVSLNETRLEYSIIFGNRLTRDAGRSGFTVDVFLGLGAGYRFSNRNYQPQDVPFPVFPEISKSGITVPIRFGFNMGYALNRLKR